VALQNETQADVVVAVELEATDTEPVDLVAGGLGVHWKQVNGGCPPPPGGHSGDALALVLDTRRYTVEAGGGGCLGGKDGANYHADARAFAVARVTPVVPSQRALSGCKQLCLIGLHSPHIAITNGSQTVAQVCGDVRHACTIAAGDWNAPIAKHSFCNYTVADRWKQLVGGESPLVGAPDVNTCCYPETKYQGWDDHVVTNIPTVMQPVVARVFGYEMTGFSNDTEEHMPIFVEVMLPEAV
jgi:hypothetical protein